jgi:hypothetical protein
MSLDINVEMVAVGFKIKMTDLQCDTELRNTFRHVRPLIY